MSAYFASDEATPPIARFTVEVVITPLPSGALMTEHRGIGIALVCGLSGMFNRSVRLPTDTATVLDVAEQVATRAGEAMADLVYAKLLEIKP